MMYTRVPIVPPRAAETRANRAGFSLIELLLVLIFLTIISLAVVPIFHGSLATVHADYTLRDIVALLKYAQERAVTDTTLFRFYMDPERGEYWLMRLGAVDGAPEFVPIREKQALRRRLPENIAMNKPKAHQDKDMNAFYIEFHPSGACDVARIELVKDDRTRIRIETSGRLGQIEVTEK